MIVHDGLPALSPFRLDRLNRELAAVAPRSRVDAAWWVYFVDPEANAPDPVKLCEVLRAQAGAPRAATLWAVPRLGTLSPWSSKATDILRGCGFAVARVERGIAYCVDQAPAAGSAEFDRLAQALHDPMTQSVLTTLDAAVALFGAGAPAPLQRTALGSDPVAALGEANRRLGLAL
ncbi:MAG: phosphoribosylformylglycinamidine synthase, partial [Proteobacteria bacterium]|nr:phosphoribosylformylglycinamidine synthase [Pseudomonadota bacterium]